jgi:hypothetical protein
MTNTQTTTDRPLTHKDIRDLLTSFAATIELDQIRVDALTSEKFHPAYDDRMWRRCRRDHLEFIDQLLPTVDTIPSALLQRLSQLAATYEPEIIRELIVDLFSVAANGVCPPEEFETAELFFGWLINDASRRTAPGEPLNGDARGLMMQWLSVTDPLRIAKDPECGYGPPAGFVS